MKKVKTKNNNNKASKTKVARPVALKNKASNGNGNGQGKVNSKIEPVLSKCAADYLCALEDPFNCVDDACVPMLPSFPSRKVKCFIKTVAIAGPQGFAFAFGFPRMGNNANCLWTSTNLYAGAALFSTGAGSAAWMNNSDYQVAQFGAGPGFIQGRIVGAGIRLRYTGTELNRAGEYRCIEEPHHGNLDGLTPGQVDAYDKSRKFPVTREWVSVTYHPIAPGDLDYSNNDFAETFNGFLGIGVTGCVPTAPFDVEYYVVFEAIGSLARGKTPSMSDSLGVDAVLNVVQAKPKDGYQGVPPLTKMLMMARDGIVNIMSGLGSLAWENRGLIAGTLMKSLIL